MSITLDIKQMPSWVKFLLTMAVPLVTGAVGYGEMRARTTATDERLGREVHALEERIDKLERLADEERRDGMRDRLLIRESIGSLQIDLARICARLKCEGSRK